MYGLAQVLKQAMVDLVKEGDISLQLTVDLSSVINSVSLDFYLWNYAKTNSSQMNQFPIHRTLTHFY